MIFVMPVKGEEVKCDNLFNDNLHKVCNNRFKDKKKK